MSKHGICVNMFRRYLILAVVAVAAILSAVLAFTGNGKSASTWVFTNVSPAQLAAEGVTVTPVATPDGLATSATAAAATAIAFDGGAVSTMVAPQYMHCVDTTRVPAIDQDCWVVSIDPAGEVAGGGAAISGDETWAGQSNSSPTTRAVPTWEIDFVDPATGKFIEGTLGN